MADKQRGHGAKVFHDDDEDTTYTEVLQIKKITPPPAGEFPEVDMTCLASTAVEAEPGDPPDYKSFSFDFFWDPNDTANHDLLDTMHAAKQIRNWRVELPIIGSANKWLTMTGWIIDMTAADVESATPIMRTCEVRITSAPVKSTVV